MMLSWIIELEEPQISAKGKGYIKKLKRKGENVSIENNGFQKENGMN